MIYIDKKSKGFTLIELIVTITIVAILGSVALPMLKMTLQRSKENELRTNLRQIREAIDAYKKASDEGRIEKSKLKFLRTILLDPMSPIIAANMNQLPNNWGLCSYDSEVGNPVRGEDVFDVFSQSQQLGINGVPYVQW